LDLENPIGAIVGAMVGVALGGMVGALVGGIVGAVVGGVVGSTIGCVTWGGSVTDNADAVSVAVFSFSGVSSVLPPHERVARTRTIEIMNRACLFISPPISGL